MKLSFKVYGNLAELPLTFPHFYTLLSILKRKDTTLWKSNMWKAGDIALI
jgi:hypothetical protein